MGKINKLRLKPAVSTVTARRRRLDKERVQYKKQNRVEALGVGTDNALGHASVSWEDIPEDGMMNEIAGGSGGGGPVAEVGGAAVVGPAEVGASSGGRALPMVEDPLSGGGRQGGQQQGGGQQGGQQQGGGIALAVGGGQGGQQQGGGQQGGQQQGGGIALAVGGGQGGNASATRTDASLQGDDCAASCCSSFEKMVNWCCCS